MAVKERHSNANTGAIASGAQSAWIDLRQSTSALAYVDADATGMNIELEATDDPDGSNVFHMSEYDTTVAASAKVAITVNPAPSFMRISNATTGNLGAVDDSFIEGIREIA